MITSVIATDKPGHILCFYSSQMFLISFRNFSIWIRVRQERLVVANIKIASKHSEQHIVETDILLKYYYCHN
jgi:hypothetical protein